MKKKRLASSVLVGVVLISFGLMSMASEDYSTSTSNSTNTSATHKDVDVSVDSAENDLTGTYFGVNGSILVLFSDGTADYYYSGKKEVDHSNSWSYDASVDTLSLSMNETSLFGSYEIKASVDGDVSSFNLVGDAFFWDDEMYYKISADVDSYTVNNCKKLIKQFTLDHPDIETNIKEKTFVPPTGTDTSKIIATLDLSELDEPAIYSNNLYRYSFDVSYSDGMENPALFRPSNGYEYIIVTSTCENNSAVTRHYDSLEFGCKADDVECGEAYYLLELEYDRSVDISVGESGIIQFAYTIPEDAKKIEIEFREDGTTSQKVVVLCK